MRPNAVKRVLKTGKPSVGTWLSLGSITASRFMARAGFQWLTVDIEHSLVGWETATHMFASIADAGCSALCRVPANRHDHIKRVLDNGAYGVVVPMVNTVEEAQHAVAACLYPPRGNRSVGGAVHALNFQTSAQDYYDHVDDELLIVLQCEHPMAVENAEKIYGVGGVDAVFIGPNDLAANMRTKDGKPPSAQATKEAHDHVLKACKKLGIAAGIHCYGADEVNQRIAEGWQFMAISSELKFMLNGAAAEMKKLKDGGAQTADMAKY